MLPIPGVSKLELYGIIAVVVMLIVGSAYGYYKWSSAKIEALQQEVTTQKLRSDLLDNTITAMKNDMAVIKQATDKANTDIATARNAAAQAARNIRAQDLNKAGNTDAAALQAQINKSLSDSFKALENASAP